MNEKAKEVLHQLKHKNQLELQFSNYQDVTGLELLVGWGQI